MERRALGLLAALGAVAAVGGVLRIACVGRACIRHEDAGARAPVCSLPEDRRTLLANGFREGRSPDVLALAPERPIAGGSAFQGATEAPAWPSGARAIDPRAPVAFGGAGVDTAAALPDDFGLDDVAPTAAAIIGLNRPHPEVRSGRAAPSVATGDVPRLLLLVAVKGLGAAELEEEPGDWPTVLELIEGGPGTTSATTGSVPLDPTAILATLGTGGLPRQHGIVGGFLRNDDGELARAWSSRAPVSVISTLSDDLDESTGQRSRIALIANEVEDRGIIGGHWYVDVDRDDISIGADPIKAAGRLLARGYGRDEVVDVMAVVLDGGDSPADDLLEELVDRTAAATHGSTAFVVAGTGGLTPVDDAVVDGVALGREVEDALPGSRAFLEAVGVGGFFVDQATLERERMSEEEIIRSALALRDDDRQPLIASAFPAIAVSLIGYC